LAEVERSRPFLVGLVGDRYGWVPPPDRMAAAAREIGFKGPVVGRSITDLEINYAVLASAEQRQRCYFYLRHPLPYDTMAPDVAAQYTEVPASGDAARKLSALKQTLEENLPDRVRHYNANWDPATQSVTGLEAWGGLVLEDLWRELDGETLELARRGEASWEEAERWILEQFVEDRGRDFIGRDEILAELLDLANSGDSENPIWGVSVGGPAGAGKSALFAELYRRLTSEQVVVLAHAAGIGPRSTQVDAMLQRWVAELAATLDTENPLGDDASVEEIQLSFQALLGRASAQRRVVVLIDALNQFESTTRARHLTWLPQLWPPNARLITTAIPGTGSEALTGRAGVKSLPLPPLSETEGAAIAEAVCQRYHRTISPRVLSSLLQKRSAAGHTAAGNPLWLELAVEELNLLDADDFARAEREFAGTPEQQLHQLLLTITEEMPPDVEELYGWMMERAEGIFGRPWAQTFVNLIAVSRAGWRESDLSVLMPQLSGEAWDALRFAALRRAFRAHVVARGADGQWDSSHAQLRLAVTRRNLAEVWRVRSLHSAIVDHLEALPRNDPLHETESMAHMIGADDRQRAAVYYGRELTDGEIAGATRVLADHIRGGDATTSEYGVAWVTSLLAQDDLDDDQRWRLCNRFNSYLHNRLRSDADLRTRLALFQASKETLERLVMQQPNNAEWLRDLSAARVGIGQILQQQGDTGAALEAYRSALEIAQSLGAQEPTSADWLRALLGSHHGVGDVLLAQGNAAEALRAYGAAVDIAERLMAQDPCNTTWQRDLSFAYEKVGEVLWAQKDQAAALNAYSRALAIRQRLVAQDPSNAMWLRDVSVSHSKAGDLLVEQGDVATALEAYRASREIAESLVAADPSNAEWQRDLCMDHIKTADVLLAQGNPVAAYAGYGSALGIAERLATQDPSNATAQRDLSVIFFESGEVLMTLDDANFALRAYGAAAAIRQRLTTQDPSNAIWQRDRFEALIKVGEVLASQGETASALENYRAARTVSDILAAQDPDNAATQINLSVSCERVGQTLLALGETAAALEEFKMSLSTRMRLAVRDPENAEWPLPLLIANYNIAAVLGASEGAGKARPYWHQCHEVLGAMRSRGLPIAPQVLELFEEEHKVVRKRGPKPPGRERRTVAAGMRNVPFIIGCVLGSMGALLTLIGE